MGRWTARLRQAEKIQECGITRPDETDNTPTAVGFGSFVSSSGEQIQKFSTPAPAEDAGGSVSFVSDPSGRFRVFFSEPDRSEWGGDDWQAAYEERAAILEYDAGMPRAEAEAMARDEISALISGVA
ncbi:hypothetical protein EJV44_11290 [Ancylobacter aquaticus]|nr:hypothetical protein EJV44_11290 [Ancylobacter aquaticus]